MQSVKELLDLDPVGAGIYAFLNRSADSNRITSCTEQRILVRYHRTWRSASTSGQVRQAADVSWSLGMYMSGFFPCMMFGIPGAALAMVKCAKPAKKKAAIGLVASAAICAFICGVTEPFEFGFMFLAPGTLC